jgi:hypothetical protein
VESAAFEQGLDAGFEGGVLERAELVEQRRDEGRVRPGQQQRERDPRQPGVQPPYRMADAPSANSFGRQRSAEHEQQGEPLR